MRVEAWEEAAAAFRKAIEIDRRFEDAYYSLGRALMNQKKYGDAIAAYTECRDLYRAQTGEQFSNQQEAQRYTGSPMELDEVIRQMQTGPQTARTQDRLRQVQEQRRQLKDYLQRGASITISITCRRSFRSPSAARNFVPASSPCQRETKQPLPPTLEPVKLKSILRWCISRPNGTRRLTVPSQLLNGLVPRYSPAAETGHQGQTEEEHAVVGRTGLPVRNQSEPTNKEW